MELEELYNIVAGTLIDGKVPRWENPKDGEMKIVEQAIRNSNSRLDERIKKGDNMFMEFPENREWFKKVIREECKKALDGKEKVEFT
jgi:hypothetical protein